MEPYNSTPQSDESTPTNDSSDSKRNKTKLLSLGTIFVLLIILAITLYLYVQKNGSQTINQSKDINNQNAAANLPEEARIKEVKEKYDGIVCKQFDSIEEALKEVEIACTLDLSGQNLSSIPEEVTGLKYLNEIILSDNNFKSFPEILTQIPSLVSVDLTNNQLSSIPEDITAKLPNLQSIKLEKNNLSEEIVTKYSEISPTQ